MDSHSYTLADIVSYFDSIKRWYPDGFPDSAIVDAIIDKNEEATAPGYGSSESGVCFFGSLSESKKAQELLQAAIEKGMKLKIDSLYFVDLKKEVLPIQAELLAQQGIDFIVALGEEAAAQLALRAESGSWQDFSGMRVLSTHGLTEILANQEYKKQFWSHLQMLMKEMMA